jgi:collagen type III alpha
MKISRTSIIITTIISAVVLTAGVASAKDGHGGKCNGMFEQMDVNKDGKITKVESAQAAAERFKKVDTNGDGAFTQEELRAAHEARHGDRGGNRAKERKDGASRDGKSRDGKSRDGKARSGHRGHGPGGMFAKLDANKDGKVTRAEAQQAETARFTAVDANKDGAITQVEMKAAHEARRNGRKPAGT